MIGTIQDYTLDMASEASKQPLIVKQGDTNSRWARITLKAFKELWTIPFGCKAYINVHKRDGTYANATCIQEGEHTVLAPITEQMTAVTGTHLGELYFLGSDGDIKSQTFPLAVWDSVVGVDRIVSSHDFQMLKEALDEVKVTTGAAGNAIQYAMEQGNAAKNGAQRANDAADSIQVAVDASKAAKASETNAKASETAAAQTQQEVTDYVESQKAAFVGYSKRETDSQYANAIIKTATGAGRVDVDDAWTAPVIGLDVAGKSEQVVTTGAQLIPYPYAEKDGTFDGITVKTANGHIKISGTTTKGTNFNIYQVSAGEYAVKVKGVHTGMDLRAFDSTERVVLATLSSSDKDAVSDAFTVPEGHSALLYFNQDNANVAVNIDVDIMMTTPDKINTPYEPYTGAAASPSPAYPQQIVSTGTVGTGAQLLPQTANETGTTVGVKWRMENGYIVLNGVSSGETSAGTDIKIVGSNDTYVDANFPPGLIQMRAQEMPPNATLFVSQKISDGTILLWHTDSDVSTNAFTHSVGDTYRIFLRITRAGASFNNAKVIVMFNVGPYAKPWEPYTGGKPAPSAEYPQEMTVRATGANLWAWGDVTGSITRVGVEIKPGTYTLTADVTSDDTDDAVCLVYNWDAGRMIGYLNRGMRKSITFTLEDITHIIGFYASRGYDDSSGDTASFKNIMLNSGDQPLPWEPYRTAAATITLTEPLRGIGEYRDRLGYRDGVWGIERYWKSMILDGEVSYDIFNQLVVSKEIRPKNKNIKPVNGLFSNLRTVELSWGDDRVGIGSFLGASAMADYKLITIRIPIDADPAEYMTEHPTEVMYQPSDYPLWTPLPDSAQQALNELTTFAGTTHLTITTGGTTPDVTLDYVQDTHKALEECRETAKDYTNNQIAEILALLPTATQAAIIDNGASTLLAESEV